eukprot:gnl/Hemi2/21764_TR7266_c0_g1_i1.p1 gnl/Hemi2/21764_TR7266_c0_g1~~gnl/Hemi2/21764_TR7266_c0_g1_i1.p1  ORF type:complete len:203 (-),score=38.25 gnl/Hemi2/21764_TR7266_c0_g1_i1:49-657(-)
MVLERLFKYATEMLADRGYVPTPEYRDAQRVINDLHSFNSGLFLCARRGETDYLGVFVALDTSGANSGCISEKLSAKKATTAVSLATGRGFSHLIIVFEQSCDARVRRLLEECKRFKVELFLAHSLLHNPTRHPDYNVHTLLDKAQVEELLRERSTVLAQVPVLGAKEAIVRWFGWEPGSVVQIQRKATGHTPATLGWRRIV